MNTSMHNSPLFVGFVILELANIASCDFLSKICGFGRFGVNDIINGEFYTNETDSTNNNKPIWYSSNSDLAIEWGAKYWPSTSLSDKYAFKLPLSTSRYGYCNISNADPIDCDGNWIIYNGTHEAIDSDYMMFNCSYFESRSDNCNDESYLTSIGITPFNSTCINNLTHGTYIQGNYKYTNNCTQLIPLPIYRLYSDMFDTFDIYLYYSWNSGLWIIGSDVMNSDYGFAFCTSGKDWINDCKTIWEYYYCTGEFIETADVSILANSNDQDCSVNITTDFTCATTGQPTFATTQVLPSSIPTISPVFQPTGEPTANETNLVNVEMTSGTVSSTKGADIDEDEDSKDITLLIICIWGGIICCVVIVGIVILRMSNKKKNTNETEIDLAKKINKDKGVRSLQPITSQSTKLSQMAPKIVPRRTNSFDEDIDGADIGEGNPDKNDSMIIINTEEGEMQQINSDCNPGLNSFSQYIY